MASLPDLSASSTKTSVEVVLKTGEVICKGQAHRLTLLENGLRLVSVHKPSVTNVEERVLDLPWRDVVRASEVPADWSRPTSGSDTTTLQNKTFVLHYAHKPTDKSNMLRCQQVQLELTDGSSSDVWISQIEEERKQGKPQNLLVVVNTIGGRGTAPLTYQNEIQPLFTLAGINTVVKVTERARHAMEIGKTFDICTVDGVVAVGGDGLYMELLHALVLRTQEAAGVDIHNPEAKLVSPPVRIGCIPAGSGNATSKWLNGGVLDIETATLNIIRGETYATNVFSIHEPAKLVCYCGVIVCNGSFSSGIRRTDELRWMRSARYLYSMLAGLFRKKPIYDMEIEVLHKSPKQPAGKDDKGRDGATSSAVTSVFRWKHAPEPLEDSSAQTPRFRLPWLDQTWSEAYLCHVRILGEDK